MYKSGIVVVLCKSGIVVVLCKSGIVVVLCKSGIVAQVLSYRRSVYNSDIIVGLYKYGIVSGTGLAIS